MDEKTSIIYTLVRDLSADVVVVVDNRGVVTAAEGRQEKEAQHIATIARAKTLEFVKLAEEIGGGRNVAAGVLRYGDKGLLFFRGGSETLLALMWPRMASEVAEIADRVARGQGLRCPSCGALLEPYTIICPSCGRKVPFTSEKCPYCSADLRKKRCPKCGAEIVINNGRAVLASEARENLQQEEEKPKSPRKLSLDLTLAATASAISIAVAAVTPSPVSGVASAIPAIAGAFVLAVSRGGGRR